MCISAKQSTLKSCWVTVFFFGSLFAVVPIPFLVIGLLTLITEENYLISEGNL